MKNLYDERYEYLFIDMEWNQRKGTTELEHREPIQIGIIGTNENLECEKTFSKGIRLKDGEALTEETSKLVGVTKASVMQAKSEAEILEKVKLSFPVYKYVVVWTKDTYELFKTGMERAEIKMPRHRVVVLQNVLRIIALDKEKNIGFETALINGGISYTSRHLHCSKYDVRYLYELFKVLYFKYQLLVAEESVFVNSRTRIIHSLNCKYVQGKTVESQSCEKQLLFYGYRPCLCCGTKQEWKRLQWKLKNRKKKKPETEKDIRNLVLTDENIQRICSQFGVECNIAEGLICIKTSVGYWRVYLSENKVKKVFHGNYKVKNRSHMLKKKKKCNEDFHEQDISMDNFYDVVKYIYYHDKNMYKEKKSRIDRLFEQIKQEQSNVVK